MELTSMKFLLAYIKTKLRSKEFGKLFPIINIYGPYGEKKVFSNNFKMMDMVRKYNVIFGRDLH